MVFRFLGILIQANESVIFRKEMLFFQIFQVNIAIIHPLIGVIICIHVVLGNLSVPDFNNAVCKEIGNSPLVGHQDYQAFLCDIFQNAHPPK